MMNKKLFLSVLLIAVVGIGMVATQVRTSTAQLKALCDQKVQFTEKFSISFYNDRLDQKRWFNLIPNDQKVFDGELKSLQKFILSGIFAGNDGDYCDISFNGNKCATITGNATTQTWANNNNNCHEFLKVHDVNGIEVDCYLNGPKVNLWSIDEMLYVGTLNTC